MASIKDFDYSEKLVDFILQGIENNLSSKEMFNEAASMGYKSDSESFRRYINRIKKRFGMIRKEDMVSEVDAKLIKILENKKIIKEEELLSNLKCSRTTLNKSIKDCRRCGYEILQDNGNIFLSTIKVRDSEKVTQLSTQEIVFGIVSDPHFGSKSCQITALNEFAEIMKNKGVRHVFCPGDFVSGYDVYPGQVHDVYALSATEQEESALVNLPLGFDWYVLGGNHDYSFIKRGGGYNIISVIASKRKDVHYVGFDEANIPILTGVDLKMVHPSGGIPYSVSYRLQKNIEQITISELQNVVRGVKDKPTIRFVLLGHLHVQIQALFGSIWGAQCGTFEGQTNYLKKKGLVPAIGGYIVKATLGKNGLLKNFEAKFYLFDEIEDDWRNYKHSIPQLKITKPIME